MNRTLLAAIFALAASGPAAGTEDAEAYFRQAFSQTCVADGESAAADYFPTESWTLTWEEDYSDTRSSATLYQFFCSAGAYNATLVYLLDTELGGLMPVSFATPQYDVKYAGDDFESDVESISLRGFTTQSMLTNPEFDPETQSITDHVLWRGLGDAFASGHWVFEKGNFVLKTFDVDASYDGEMNPTRIVEYE